MGGLNRVSGSPNSELRGLKVPAGLLILPKSPGVFLHLLHGDHGSFPEQHLPSKSCDTACTGDKLNTRLLCALLDMGSCLGTPAPSACEMLEAPAASSSFSTHTKPLEGARDVCVRPPRIVLQAVVGAWYMGVRGGIPVLCKVSTC